jgi:hypothetical protein
MTIKQQRAFKNIMENGGNVTAGMREAGYAESTINNPGNLTKSRTWEQLMDEFLPDSKLMDVNKEGLDAVRTISATVIIRSNDPTVKNKQATSRDVDFIDVPDFAIRHKYLETALKIKGKLIEKVKNEHSGVDGEPISVLFKSKSE